jgi:N6-L-threonylcarbamoyladenine synthase
MHGGAFLCSEVASQSAVHSEFGGVVPEVASRNHLCTIQPLIARALTGAGVPLEKMDAFAATRGPGLATSLMIGMSAARGLAVAFAKPFLAINHLEGHLLSPFFGTSIAVGPAIALVVSGGHTLLVDIAAFGKYRVVGQTHDDAAGEAFDKVGKMLGLPYPGGPNVNRLAEQGDRARHAFPRSMIDSGDFHFSLADSKHLSAHCFRSSRKSVCPICAHRFRRRLWKFL